MTPERIDPGTTFTPVQAALFDTSEDELRKLDLLAAMTLRARSHRFTVGFSWAFNLSGGGYTVTTSGSGTETFVRGKSNDSGEGTMATDSAGVPATISVLRISGSGTITPPMGGAESASIFAGDSGPVLDMSPAPIFLSNPQRMSQRLEAFNRLQLSLVSAHYSVLLTNLVALSINRGIGDVESGVCTFGYPLMWPGTVTLPMWTPDPDWLPPVWEAAPGIPISGSASFAFDGATLEDDGEFWPYGFDPLSPYTVTTDHALWDATTGAPLRSTRAIVRAPLLAV